MRSKDDSTQVGAALSQGGLSRVFPRDPAEMTDREVRWEMVRCCLKAAWWALRGDVSTVCVYLVRLREVVEEDQGKPFHHGDHWWRWNGS